MPQEAMTGDAAISERTRRALEAIGASWASMPADQRDRVRQEHLAAARGARGNYAALCAMQDWLTELRTASRKVPANRRLGMNEVIESVTEALDRLGIPYAITGSIASSIHGEPVTSLDIDIVVRLGPQQAGALAAALQGRFFAQAEVIEEAAAHHGIASILPVDVGPKIDLSALEDTPYHAEVLRRRVLIRTDEARPGFWVVSPEDIILMKLVWRKDSRSAKQWANALSVAKSRGRALDWAYLRHWAGELGVIADLEQLIVEAGI